MLTGAAGGSGFKGIAGRFSRVGLQRYAPDIPLSLRFTRLDNGHAVDAAADLTLARKGADQVPSLERCVRSAAEPDSIGELGRIWQAHVAHLLLDMHDDPGVFVIRHVWRRSLSASPREPVLAEPAADRRADA